MTPAPAPGERSWLAASPAVVILARSPFAAGKTRLTAGLDPADAHALRAALLLDTIEAALAAGWPLHVHLTPGSDAARVTTWLADDPALAAHASHVRCHAQADGDLGARMIAAVGATLAAGHDVAVLVGSDIPDLPVEALTSACAALTAAPRDRALAFGAAADGGFYLVAATDVASLAAGYAGVAWSQPSVLADVCARLAASGRQALRVMPWHDLDDRTDLAALLARPGAAAPRTRAVARRLPP